MSKIGVFARPGIRCKVIFGKELKKFSHLGIFGVGYMQNLSNSGDEEVK